MLITLSIEIIFVRARLGGVLLLPSGAGRDHSANALFYLILYGFNSIFIHNAVMRLFFKTKFSYHHIVGHRYFGMLKRFFRAGNRTAINTYNAIGAFARCDHARIMASNAGKAEHLCNAFLLQINGSLICDLHYIRCARAGKNYNILRST